MTNTEALANIETMIHHNRARPLLANGSEEIRQPVEFGGHVFQVVWLENLDMHALFQMRDGSVSLVVMHNNGFSCHEVVKRIVTGHLKGAEAQMRFIQNCGGLSTLPENFLSQFQPQPTCPK